MALSIESINEQFITIGTTDYDLVIDVGGTPDTVDVTGHMEGFSQHWDATNEQLHIKSAEVTRLLSGVTWDIKAVKDTQTLMAKVAYNVIQAAPIFETLGTIHLYRGVPINFDIVIKNIPPLMIPNARLLGLKSELVEYGLNIKGKLSSTDNFTINTGNVKIIIPSETGGADTVYTYPYTVEAGSPPSMGTPDFTPNGAFGVLTLSAVTHAMDYEWTVEAGDQATWHRFSSTRQVIDLRKLEVIPGKLNLTLKFPNISGASSYEYKLESDSHEVDWTRFTGTLSSGTITTIIPNLEDGVQYTLRLRVASPWAGTPVSITVYGGHIVYTVQRDSTSPYTDYYLYIFHTGWGDGQVATRIKRLLLPTSLDYVEEGGLAVTPTGDVYILNRLHDGSRGDGNLYYFSAATVAAAADGARLAATRKNPIQVSNLSWNRCYGIGFYKNEIYINVSRFVGALTNLDDEFAAFTPPATTGTAITTFREIDVPVVAESKGMDVNAQNLYRIGSSEKIEQFDRVLGTLGAQIVARNNTGKAYSRIDGLKRVGNGFYVLPNTTAHHDPNVLAYVEYDTANSQWRATREINLPAGLDKPIFLDILK